VGVTRHIVSGPTGPLVRVWSAECDSPTDFSSIASVNPGIGFARIGGRTALHLRGPATRATTLSCPADTEYFGVDFRLGAYLPMFPPAGLVNLNDAVLPTLPDGRVLLDGGAWEMPTPTNVDVFVDRLVRVGLLVVDPLVEDLRHGDVRGLPARTAQSRFLRAVGLSRRKLRVIERARRAARQLRAGAPIADVVFAGGYHDQPQLTRSLRELLGYTPGEVARGEMFLDL
jgi:Helix-turn-helix domain